jgi:hypothetical protein
MKNTNGSKYRFKHSLIGLFLPLVIILLGLLCTAFSGLYILWYPIYLIITIPGYLVHGEGYLTLAIISLFWGTAGFAIGYAKDLRVAADNKNEKQSE